MSAHLTGRAQPPQRRTLPLPDLVTPHPPTKPSLLHLRGPPISSPPGPRTPSSLARDMPSAPTRLDYRRPSRSPHVFHDLRTATILAPSKPMRMSTGQPARGSTSRRALPPLPGRAAMVDDVAPGQPYRDYESVLEVARDAAYPLTAAELKTAVDQHLRLGHPLRRAPPRVRSARAR